MVLQLLTLTKVRNLDLGTVIGSSAPGTVTINADTGSRFVGGGVIGVPNYPGNRGVF